MFNAAVFLRNEDLRTRANFPTEVQGMHSTLKRANDALITLIRDYHYFISVY